MNLIKLRKKSQHAVILTTHKYSTHHLKVGKVITMYRCIQQKKLWLKYKIFYIIQLYHFEHK